MPVELENVSGCTEDVENGKSREAISVNKRQKLVAPSLRGQFDPLQVRQSSSEPGNNESKDGSARLQAVSDLGLTGNVLHAAGLRLS